MVQVRECKRHLSDNLCPPLGSLCSAKPIRKQLTRAAQETSVPSSPFFSPPPPSSSSPRPRSPLSVVFTSLSSAVCFCAVAACFVFSYISSGRKHLYAYSQLLIYTHAQSLKHWAAKAWDASGGRREGGRGGGSKNCLYI